MNMKMTFKKITLQEAAAIWLTLMKEGKQVTSKKVGGSIEIEWADQPKEVKKP